MKIELHERMKMLSMLSECINLFEIRAPVRFAERFIMFNIFEILFLRIFDVKNILILFCITDCFVSVYQLLFQLFHLNLLIPILKMMSKSDAEREYQKELDRYRSQQVVINALLAVKDEVEPDIVQSINVTYLSNDLKMDRDGVDSLFGIIYLFRFSADCIVLYKIYNYTHRYNTLIKVT